MHKTKSVWYIGRHDMLKTSGIFLFLAFAIIVHASKDRSHPASTAALLERAARNAVDHPEKIPSLVQAIKKARSSGTANAAICEKTGAFLDWFTKLVLENQSADDGLLCPLLYDYQRIFDAIGSDACFHDEINLLMNRAFSNCHVQSRHQEDLQCIATATKVSVPDSKEAEYIFDDRCSLKLLSIPTHGELDRSVYAVIPNGVKCNAVVPASVVNRGRGYHGDVATEALELSGRETITLICQWTAGIKKFWIVNYPDNPGLQFR